MRFNYRDGVYLHDLDLWLDAHTSTPAGVVSHAHADYARPHAQTLVTEATARLLRGRRFATACLTSLPLRQRLARGGGYLTLVPAGHVLGSAQVLVECDGERLLYSGDLKLRAGLTAEPAEIPAAETLVMESTFGLPRYRFPPFEEVAGRIEQFCRGAIEAGATPVLFAYSLGKAQEVLAALASSGLPLSVHPSVDAICRVYRACGVDLPAYETGIGREQRGRVVITPPQARRKALDDLGAIRTAYLSGWALDRGAVYRFRCDAALPLSDHADYDELLEYVERVGPRQVFTLHGFAREFARDLRARGYEAYSLTQPDQLALF